MGGAATAGSSSVAGAPAHGGGGASGAPSEGGSGGAACTKCPTKCCDAGATCVDDGLGNLACKKTCTTSSQCPTTQCCELLKDGTGVCAAGTGDNLCRCSTGAECSTKACAPNIDTQGNPVGPYVCVPNDGAAYHGCNGALSTCGGTDCCFIDAKANQFCVAPCLNDSQCGDAACVTYPAKSSTCAGMMGCGPM